MTIASQTSRISYTGDGATTAFAVPFFFSANSDLVVSTITAAGVITAQTLGTNYTLSGATLSAGGTCTFLVAPPAGTSVTIYRDPPITQTTSYNNNDPFPAKVHEAALDKTATIDQRSRDMILRSLRLADGDVALDMTMPTAAVRKNLGLAFDSTGKPIAISTVGPAGPSGAAQTYDTRAQAAGSTIPVILTTIWITAYATGYPTAPAPYKPGGSGGPMAFQDAAGNWWVLDVSGGSINPYWCGVKNVGTANDDYAALVLTRDISRASVVPIILPGGFNASFGTKLECAYFNARWIAETPLCKLTFTGTGIGISFDGTAFDSVGAGPSGCVFGGVYPVTLTGNPNCTVLLYYNKCQNAVFNIDAHDCSKALLWSGTAPTGGPTLWSGVDNKITVTCRYGNLATRPEFATYIEGLYASKVFIYASACGTIASQQVFFLTCVNNRITGNSESGLNGGLWLTSDCDSNTLINWFCEDNGSNPAGIPDMVINGNDNVLINCTGVVTAAGSLKITGSNNTVENCRLLVKTEIAATATLTVFRNNTVTGTLIDNGTLTTREGNNGWSDYTDFTPGMVSSSGTLSIVANLLGRYKVSGKSVRYWITGQVQGVGTGSGHINFTGLPIAPLRDVTFAGREVSSTQKALTGFLPATATTLQVQLYDGTFPGGGTYVLEGEFQVIA